MRPAELITRPNEILVGDTFTLEFWCGTSLDKIKICREGDIVIFNEIDPSSGNIKQRLKDIDTFTDTFPLTRTSVGNTATLRSIAVMEGTFIAEAGVACVSSCLPDQPPIQVGERLTVTIKKKPSMISTPIPSTPVINVPSVIPTPQPIATPPTFSTRETLRIPIISDIIDFIMRLFGL